MEISPANKHEHHVHGEIFCYSTLSSDQDVNKQYDQHNNPLYAYTATRDPDTWVSSPRHKTKAWPQILQSHAEIDNRLGKNFSVIHKSRFPRMPQYSWQYDNPQGRDTSNPVL